MPETQTGNAVRLEFAPGSLEQTNRSGSTFPCHWPWGAGDEDWGTDCRDGEHTVFGDLLRHKRWLPALTKHE